MQLIKQQNWTRCEGTRPLPPALLPTEIAESRLIAVLRAPSSRHLAQAARRLSDVGVRCIEITLTTPGALAVIEELAATGGADMLVGAGTVIDSSDAENAIAAGATYLLSPLYARDVVDLATTRGVPMIPGAATPSEIAAAWRRGCAAVKVFPAASLGGPGYIKSVRDPLPEITLIPTGGITAADVPHYLAAGAAAVGVGSPLTGRSLLTGDFGDLDRRAREFLTATRREPAAR